MKQGFTQEWKTKSTPDFNYFFTDAYEQDVPIFDSLFREDLGKMQQAVNYYLSQPIDVFLCHSEWQRQDLLKRKFEEEEEGAGEIRMNPYTIAIKVNDDFPTIRKQFKKGAVEVLVDEMMSGSSLQDNIKSANLLYMPDWVLPGLVHYLSDDWSSATDNTWRYVYDTYTFSNLNSIPKEYQAIKGASFWKYMHHRYGINSLSTVLYMARLTRKFNASLFYAFQEPSKQIFKDWVDFYETAYMADQQKAIPVSGYVLPASDVIDLFVQSPTVFYSLEHTLGNPSLFKTSIMNGEVAKEKLFSLPLKARLLPPFTGSLQVTDDKACVFYMGETGLMYETKDGSSHLGLSDVREIKQGFQKQTDEASIYILTSKRDKSEVYRLDSKEKLELIFSQALFMSSFDISNGHLLFHSDNGGNDLALVSLSSKVLEKRIALSGNVQQFEFADDSTVLFNSDENGIVNGKLLNLNTGQESFVTNYRSDIGFHQFEKSFFAEYILREEESELHITEALSVSEFYTYDSIHPSYFVAYGSPWKTDKEQNLVEEFPDSLMDYSFESPFAAPNDFRLSNYDSLLKLTPSSLNASRMSTLAVDQFKVSNLRLHIYNEMMVNNELGYENAIEMVDPSIFYICGKAMFKNSFNTRSFGVAYAGGIHPDHPKNRDIAFTYQSRKTYNMDASLLHRQRVQFTSELSNKFLVSRLHVGLGKQVAPGLVFSINPVLRLDQNIVLITNDVSATLPDKRSFIGEIGLGLKHDLGESKNTWVKSHFLSSPYWQNTSKSINLKSRLTVEAQHDFAENVSVKLRALAANSIGQAPTFYVIGGASSDLAASLDTGALASYTEPALYSMEFGVRGFPVNYRNGTSVMFANLDIGIKPIQLLSSRPSVSELMSNFSVFLFSDIGTAFYGVNYFDERNTLNTQVVLSSTGTIQATVNAIKNPMLASFGFGAGTELYSYKIRVDAAYGLEEQKLAERPMIHVRLGRAL